MTTGEGPAKKNLTTLPEVVQMKTAVATKDAP